MRIYSLMIALLMSSLVLTGCSDDDDDDEPAGGSTFTADGNAASSVSVFAIDDGAGTRTVTIDDADGNRTVSILIDGEETAETKEYTFGQQTTVNLLYNDGTTTSSLTATSGSLTLTKNTETEVAGNFDVEVSNGTGGDNVSVNGSFETSVD